MKNIFYTTTLFMLLTSTSASYAGFAIGATRVIFHEGSKEATLQIANNDSTPVLVQSWIDKEEKSQKSHFMVIPPLVLLNDGDKTDLRIIYTGDPLPQDRESLHWINIKSIPTKPSDETNANFLQIAISSKLKVIYRPKSLEKTPLSDEYGKLQWSIKNSHLTVNNPTPFIVNFSNIKFNNKTVNAPLFVAPFSMKSYPTTIRNNTGKVSWSVINDYGAITEEYTKKINSQ